jgi:hypothetical protein
MRMRARAVESRKREPVTVVAPPRKWRSIRGVCQRAPFRGVANRHGR